MYSSVSRQFPSPSATRSCNSGNYFSLRWLLSEKRNTSCVLHSDLDFLCPFLLIWKPSPSLSRDAVALYSWADAAAAKGGCSCSARTHFLAEGTTKGNSGTSVSHKLTGLNVLWALVPPSFFRRKGKSFFTSNIPDNKHRDNTCETSRVCLDFLLQTIRPFAKGSKKFSASSTQPLDLLTCLVQS